MSSNEQSTGLSEISCAVAQLDEITQRNAQMVDAGKHSNGVAERTAQGIEQRVHPAMVPRTASLAQVMGVTNAVTIDGVAVPPATLAYR